MSRELNFGTPLESANSGSRNLSPAQGFWDRRNQLIEIKCTLFNFYW